MQERLNLKKRIPKAYCTRNNGTSSDILSLGSTSGFSGTTDRGSSQLKKKK